MEGARGLRRRRKAAAAPLMAPPRLTFLTRPVLTWSKWKYDPVCIMSTHLKEVEGISAMGGKAATTNHMTTRCSRRHRTVRMRWR